MLCNQSGRIFSWWKWNSRQVALPAHRMDQQAIEEFVGITQASAKVARQFLTAFDNDVPAAIEAFFEDPQKYESPTAVSEPTFIDEDLGEDAIPEPEEYVRAPMQPVKRRLVADDAPIARGRGRGGIQPTEAFRDLRAEQTAHFSGTIHHYHLLLTKFSRSSRI